MAEVVFLVGAFLASSRPRAVQAYAARVLAYGLAVQGDARAAVEALASVSADTPTVQTTRWCATPVG